MPFNPSAGDWGNEVGNSARPTLYLLTGNNMTGSSATQQGRAIGYCRGVLRLECGHTEISVAANPGPWTYTSAAAAAVRDLKQWFHDNADSSIVVNNVCDAKGWELLDVCVIW